MILLSWYGANDVKIRISKLPVNINTWKNPNVKI
jgi:hypothetical protein